MESLPHSLHNEICKYLTFEENVQMHVLNTKFHHKTSSSLQRLYLYDYQSSLPDLTAKVEAECLKTHPVREAAYRAVKMLKRDDMMEVRCFKMPPDVVNSVLVAVSVYLKVDPTWTQSKKWLKDPRLIGRLSKLLLGEEAYSQKEVIMAEKLLEAGLNRQQVHRCSRACVPLYDWCIAMTSIYKVKLAVESYVEKKRKLKMRIKMIKEIIHSDPWQVKSS
eukprot:CAMPEP_0115046324 /NCGR_PEP_ID=MMETSP0216-20121206/48681_1 /TAXON_ID=223996 /ORGANISM="Protocruzia adherens, Strain Boccale" /LENGTH=219 /DNA_ID=CAMNT_0002429383 /DNA_START=655 /DNA_END=1314 /DNA_ORIENTATION=+